MVYLVWESVGKRQFRSVLLDFVSASLYCRAEISVGVQAVIAAPCAAIRNLPEVRMPKQCPRFGPIRVWEAYSACSCS